MSNYSDHQHALLARIARALERIADTLDGHSAETKYFKDSQDVKHPHHRTIVGELAGIKEIIQRK